MRFSVEVKTEGEDLRRGDLVYIKRGLYRVEHVGKLRGNLKFRVRFRLIGKVNLDREMRTDRA